MNDLVIFNNEEFGSVRTIVIDDEPWFIGKDVAVALGYKDTSDALKVHVDSEDKLSRSIADSGQNRKMYVINESGLYSLILSSKLKKAKQFKHWVTSEVLPSIRKTGSYSIDKKSSNKTQMQIASEEMEYTVKFAKSLEDFGVEKGIAKIHALEIGKGFYQVLTDTAISDIKKLLPPTKENDVAYLTPTKIAEEINNRNLFDTLIKAKSVNKALENLGYQIKENKDWKITNKAENFANMFPYENNKHTGYQIRWKYEVIDVLIEYFNDLY